MRAAFHIRTHVPLLHFQILGINLSSVYLNPAISCPRAQVNHISRLRTRVCHPIMAMIACAHKIKLYEFIIAGGGFFFLSDWSSRVVLAVVLLVIVRSFLLALISCIDPSHLAPSTPLRAGRGLPRER
jgi:hypothetical protein